jgi:cytochrome c oxidase cbb3-type subunit I/II
MQAEKFYYDNKIVKAFGYATVVFGIVGMIVGLWAAIQIYYPESSLNLPYTTFGRIRPLPMRSFLHLLVMHPLQVFIIHCNVFAKQECTATN